MFFHKYSWGLRMLNYIKLRKNCWGRRVLPKTFVFSGKRSWGLKTQRKTWNCQKNMGAFFGIFCCWKTFLGSYKNWGRGRVGGLNNRVPPQNMMQYWQTFQSDPLSRSQVITRKWIQLKRRKQEDKHIKAFLWNGWIKISASVGHMIHIMWKSIILSYQVLFRN